MPERSFAKRWSINGECRPLDLMQPALDACAIILALAAVQTLAKAAPSDAGAILGLIAVVAFLILSRVTGISRVNDRGNPNGELTAIMLTWGLTLLFLTLVGFLTRHGTQFPRSSMLAWAVLAPMAVGLERMLVRIVQQSALRRGYGARRVAIAGLNPLGTQTASNLRQNPSLGFQLLGFYDDRSVARPLPSVQGENVSTQAENWDSGEQVLGGLADLVQACRAGKVDTVLVTLPMRAEDRISGLLDQLSDSTASVYIVPDFFVFELLHSRWTNLGGLPAVSVFENPLYGVDGAIKRCADLVLALSGLAVVAIPMCLIAAAIKLTSPGPVFFRQRRYGLDGKEILVWKFRSMMTCDNGSVVRQATKGDPRVTPIGCVLRRSSLDELPQLFNVIGGSMSLVGPRPHASAHNEHYRGQIRGYMLRHKIKPGITGLAQVSGCRGETETIEKMQRRVELDHQYIRRWSLWLDMKILCKTMTVVWKQETAY